MPFWAGMLTERQHPHEELERAIRQASWDLYFRNNPMSQPPDFVEDPAMDLSSLLSGQPLRILQRDARGRNTPGQSREDRPATPGGNIAKSNGTVTSQTHQSLDNISQVGRDSSKPGRRSPGEPTLAISLDPPDSGVFLDALLRTKEAWIEVAYQDGRREVRRWDAARMSPSSNVIGNLRSRPEFRAGEWQRRGITGVRVRLRP